MQETNFYCDESCHLENDDSKFMVIGSVFCPKEKRHEIFSRIREIKLKHNLKTDFEIKWNKISKTKQTFYTEIIDYFFDDDDLHFRAIVVDKSQLNHEAFNQTHDDFYYKMYFDMLKVVINPEHKNNIFIDIKDTRGNDKVDGLCKFLRSQHYDYTNEIINKIQQIRSHEVEIMQLTDILIGTLSYLHRGLSSNSAKMNIIHRVQKRSGYSLMKNTFFRENKFNLLIWRSNYHV